MAAIRIMALAGLHDFYAEEFVEHGGRISGFENHILKVPKKDLMVIVLSNSENHDPSADFVATRIAALVLGKSYAPAAHPISSWEAKQVIGSYRLDGRFHCIDAVGGRLFIKQKGGRTREVLSLGEGQFFIVNSFDNFRLASNSHLKEEGLIVKSKYFPEAFAKKIAQRADMCN